MAPNKVIEVQAGVELIDHGNTIKGETYHKKGQFSLTEYRKVADPNEQRLSQSQLMY